MGQGNRILSCRSCRERKVRCNRRIPCQNCIRYNCEDSCQGYQGPPTSLFRKLPIQRADDSTRRNHRQTSNSIVPSPEACQPQTPISTIDDGALLGSHDAPSSWIDDMTHLTPDYRAVEPFLRTEPDHAVRSVDALHAYNNLEALRQGSRCIPSAPTSSASGLSLTPAEKLEWQVYLAACLPPRSQCDKLVTFFFEHVNWVYQSIHGPSFREEYSTFWSTPVANIDLIWLSLLYIVLCMSATFTGPNVCITAGFVDSKEDVPKTFYRLSRQSLHAGEYESRPSLTQIQVFVESQLYWYGMKAVETLNADLGRVVRCAQAIGLDKDISPSKDLQSEMRHRIWWDLCAIDTYQSLCLDRQPLIQSYMSEVPIPQNCDDSDIVASAIYPRPLEQPTVMSVNIFRARLFKVFNGLYANNGSNQISFDTVASIDAKIDSILEQYPWYLQPSEVSRDNIYLEPSKASRYVSTTLPSSFDYLRWQHHITHNSVCVQRIRMYRPFLWSHFDACWHKCIASVEGAFAIYHDLRAADPHHFPKSPKLLTQSYQTFCSAISIAAFLLVERPVLPTRIQADIEVVIQDLKSLTDNHHSLPMAVDGRKTLARILDAYHAYCRDANNARSPPESPATGSSSQLQSLVPEIYTIMGGRTNTKAYLDRCAIPYIVDLALTLDATATANQAEISDATGTVNKGRSSNARIIHRQAGASNMTGTTMHTASAGTTAAATITSPESLYPQGYSNVSDIYATNSTTGLNRDLHFDMLSWVVGDFSPFHQNTI
jgi:hypothetical protein